MTKILVLFSAIYMFLINSYILFYTTTILYSIVVGPGSYWWPNNRFKLIVYMGYVLFWVYVPKMINNWKVKNPGKNLIHFMWSW